ATTATTDPVVATTSLMASGGCYDPLRAALRSVTMLCRPRFGMLRWITGNLNDAVVQTSRRSTPTFREGSPPGTATTATTDPVVATTATTDPVVAPTATTAKLLATTPCKAPGISPPTTFLVLEA